jgi:molecular chaperone HscB
LFLRGKFRRVTDYFALFALPPRPWLDGEKLEERYRELARATHPDQSTQPAMNFAEVNEAYRILRDPKSRLQHLLALEGRPPTAATAEIPRDLTDLFLRIAPALTRNDKREIDGLSEELSLLYDGAIEQLYQINESWSKHPMTDVENLYRRFAFLTRWTKLVEEHRFNAAFSREPPCSGGV